MKPQPTLSCVGRIEKRSINNFSCHPELAAPLVADEKEAYKGGCSQSISGSSHRQKCATICTVSGKEVLDKVGWAFSPTMKLCWGRNHNLQKAISSASRKATRHVKGDLVPKVAFTLAEVLITLGIIGIVAAMTLPALISNYRVKVLESGFKKSVSTIDNALMLTANDMGLTSIKDLTELCGYPAYADDQGNLNMDDPRTQSYLNCRDSTKSFYIPQIMNSFLSHLNIAKSVDRNLLKKIDVLDYAGDVCLTYNGLYGIDVYDTESSYGLFILQDGSAISGITFLYHGATDGIGFTFDTNGPFKGPNRYGYDIFYYNTGTWEQNCSKNLHGRFSSRACYKFALVDKNPDDSTKKYWQSLKL